MKKFSVSLCVYSGDKPEWFAQAVDSIVKQTVKPDEIVIVVDGPVPLELDNIIYSFEQDSLFKVIRLDNNYGHGYARKIGLQSCSYDLIALMDADDISSPDRFEKQLPFFENNIDIVGGNISEFIGGPENVVGKRIVPTTDAEIKNYMKKRCPMNQVTVMFKKTSVEKVGGYINWYCEEDYYLWLRMFLADMKFANVPDVLVNVRVGEDMYRRRGGIKYFKSEAKLQKYMLDNKIIGFARFVLNVSERLVLQVLIPNSLRGWIFKHFARSNSDE